MVFLCSYLNVGDFELVTQSGIRGSSKVGVIFFPFSHRHRRILLFFAEYYYKGFSMVVILLTASSNFKNFREL